jgi:DNA-directed RNA polymerase specialized sigma24 family protein
LKPDVAIDQYADPRSGSFEQKLLVQSQAEAILRQVSEKHRGLVEQIYGLRNIEKVPRDVMAQRLGIPRNTLDQKLRRILRRVNKLLAQ